MVRTRRDQHQVEVGGSSSMCMCIAIVTLALRLVSGHYFRSEAEKRRKRRFTLLLAAAYQLLSIEAGGTDDNRATSETVCMIACGSLGRSGVAAVFGKETINLQRYYLLHSMYTHGKCSAK